MYKRSRRVEGIFRGALASIILCAFIGCRTDSDAAPEDSRPNALERITRPTDGATLHLVRLVQRGDQYSFQPSEITIRSGDVLRFVMVGSQPESVVFDPERASLEAAEFIRANDLQRGVLLTDAGQAYDVSFLNAPPGEYPFVSLPHGSQGMQGSVTVSSEKENSEG